MKPIQFALGSVGAATLCVVLTLAGSLDASALTMKECGAKYQAAKSAGSLNGMGWNDFREAQCGTEAAVAPAATPAAPAPVTPAAAPKPNPSPAPTIAGGNAVFPSAISPKYASESAGKARMHTCLDQYNANKASGANGGLKWIMKGGGYYSECNKHLKG
jgi:hypothetical protein